MHYKQVAESILLQFAKTYKVLSIRIAFLLSIYKLQTINF